MYGKCRTVFSRGVIAATATCLLNISAARAQMCVEHFGFNLCTLGQAELLIADIDGICDPTSGACDLELSLSDIGSSGEDGLSINADSTLCTRHWEDVVLHFSPLGPPSATSDGAFLELGAEFRTGSVQGRGTVRATDAGSDVEITADFSALGATTYTVKVYSGGVLQGTETGLTGTLATVGSWPVGGGATTQAVSKGLRWMVDSTFLVGAGVYTGDMLRIIPEGVTDPPPWMVHNASIRSKDLGTLTIIAIIAKLNEGHVIGFGGNEHTPLGLASLSTRDNDCDGFDDHQTGQRVTVCNIGSTGDDGVRINKRDEDWIRELGIGFEPPPAVDSLPVGAFLELNATGQVAGAPLAQAIGSTRATVGDYDTDGNKELEITVDFSPIGSTTYTLELYNGGVLMYSETGRTGPAGYTSTWPIGGGVSLQHPTYYFPAGTLVQPELAGPAIAADEVRMTAESPTVEPDWLTSVDIKGKDIGSLTITDEIVSPTCAKLFGITHCAEGQAELMIADIDNDGDLDCDASNLGSSGDAGLLKRPTKKNIEEHILKWGYSAGGVTVPTGSHREVELRGAVNGMPGEQVIGSLRITKVSNSEYAVTADYTPIGATSFTVEKWVNGTLVQTQTGVTGTLLTLSGLPPLVATGRNGGGAVNGAKWIWDLDSSTSYAVIPESPSSSVDGLTRIGLYGADLPSLMTDTEAMLLDDGSAIASDSEITPLGLATLSMIYDCNGVPSQSLDPVVHLCNLGASGEDGVVVNPHGAKRIVVPEWLDPEDPPGSLPTGAYMDLRANGVMPGAPAEQPLGSWRVTKINPGPNELPYEMSVDFSPLGVGSYDLEVLDALTGNVLYTETGRTNPVVGTQDHWPVGGGAEIQSKVLVVARPDSELRITGGPTVASAAGLEIRMIATPATLPDAISSLDLKTKDIPSLTLTGEPPAPRGVIPAVSEWGLVTMSLLLLIAATLVFRRRRVALSQPPLNGTWSR